MAWTAPRTWTNGETVTDVLLNTHLRDNLRFLKGMDGVIDLDDHVRLANTKEVHLRDVSGNKKHLRCNNNNLEIINNAYTQVLVIFWENGDLTLAGQRLLFASPFRAHRHPFANDRHVESGVVTHGNINSLNSNAQSATFINPFASAPRVVSTCIAATSEPFRIITSCSSISTTGFTLTAWNESTSNQTNIQSNWLAEGQD